MARPQETARLFAAIWLPDPVRTELGAQLDAHLPSAADLRRTRADTWHITLAFLGSAPIDSALRRFASLAGGLTAAAPVRLAGAGHFGPVVWVGVHSGDWLTELANATQSALRVPDRRFRPHVTVARVRGDRGGVTARAGAVAAGLADLEGTPWTPAELVLVESVLGPVPRYPVRSQLALTQAC